MKARWLLAVGLLGMMAALVATRWSQAPGLMDAEYYYSGGLRIATGKGFSEPFLWNYLDDPVGLPHAAFTYWMPMPSLLAAAGMALVGATDFAAARAPFLLLMGIIPMLTAWLAFSLTGERRIALVAGGLAAFPGFYLPFLVTTESFGLMMVWGTLFLLAAGEARKWLFRAEAAPPRQRLFTRANRSALALGLLAGAMHLTRADGLLWLMLALGWVVYLRLAARREAQPGETGIWIALTLILVGYLALMSPWMVRNLDVYGTPLPPGGSRALWFIEYDDLYAYPAAVITPARWLASGLPAILRARGDALLANLKTALGVQMEVFLLPLALVGLWRLRRDPRVGLGLLAWLGVLAAMTLAFPFAGARGGFFHSGSALQPLIWAGAAVGLEAFIGWGLRWRGWKERRAWIMFSSGLVVVAIVFSAGIYSRRVIGADSTRPVWNQGGRDLQALDRALVENGAEAGDVAMVNNPPGLFAAAGRAAIVVPNGDETTLLAAVERYRPAFVVLEGNHPVGLNELYRQPHDLPGLRYITTVSDFHIFRPDAALAAGCDPQRNPR